MKKICLALSAIGFIGLALTQPAHAISAGYRAQLERSGCTQETDGHGCDIHKTKSQNSAAASYRARHDGHQSLDSISSEVDTVIGLEYGEGANYLLDKGWRSAGLEEYKKQGWKMRVVVQSGHIVNAQIVGHSN